MKQRVSRVVSKYLAQRDKIAQNEEAVLSDSEILDTINDALRISYPTLIEDFLERQDFRLLMSFAFVITEKFNPSGDPKGMLEDKLKNLKTRIVRDIRDVAYSNSDSFKSYFYDYFRKNKVNDTESIDEYVTSYMHKVVRDSKRDYNRIKDVV